MGHLHHIPSFKAHGSLRDRGQKDWVRSGGWLHYKVFFCTQQGSYMFELTAFVTRTVWAQAKQNSSMERGGGLRVPCLAEELWTVDGHWGKKHVSMLQCKPHIQEGWATQSRLMGLKEKRVHEVGWGGKQERHCKAWERGGDEYDQNPLYEILKDLI